MPPALLVPVAAYLHSWIVSERCLSVVAAFQHALGIRRTQPPSSPPPTTTQQRVTRSSTGRNSNGGKERAQHHAAQEEYTYIGPIHFYFRVASVLGSELFYIVFLPVLIWQVDYELGRSAIIFWNLLFFVGNAMKDLLCLPRPLNPPVLCLEKQYSAEYGLPSVHALGTFVPLFCLLKHYPLPSSLPSSSFSYYYLLWLLFAASICTSRLYLGVHSMPDLVAGWVLGTALLAFGLVWGDEAEKFAIFHPLGGLVVVLVSVAMVCLYPVPDKPTPTLSYTVSVMGAGGGVLLASRRLFMEPQSLPLLQILLEPPPMGTRVSLRVVVGLCVLVAVKALAKPLATTLVEGAISTCTSGVGSPVKGRVPATTMKKDDDCEEEVGLWAFTPAELLIKYMNYFVVGWCVIGVIPAVWLVLGL